jgi:preprotein translocase subunit SecG
MLDAILSWDTLWYLLIVLYVPACLGLVIIVLLQKGKGTGFAGAFGAGAGPGSDTVFGPRAGQTLPVKLTYIAAGIFVFISLSMSLVANFVGRGNAPELLEGANAAPAQVSSGLDDLGIGKGKQGAGAQSAAPAAAAVAAPATQAPAAAAPAAPAPSAAQTTAPASTPAPANANQP